MSSTIELQFELFVDLQTYAKNVSKFNHFVAIAKIMKSNSLALKMKVKIIKLQKHIKTDAKCSCYGAMAKMVKYLCLTLQIKVKICYNSTKIWQSNVSGQKFTCKCTPRMMHLSTAVMVQWQYTAIPSLNLNMKVTDSNESVEVRKSNVPYRYATVCKK